MTDFLLFPVLPLFCAILYPIAALSLKQAMQRGAGAIRSLFLGSLMFVPAALILLFFTDEPIDLDNLLIPAIAGFFMFGGQLFTALAIRIGDITILTPMMGMKIVFVAFLTVLIGAGNVTLASWLAAILAATSVFILGYTGFKNRRVLLLTAGFAISASLSFGLADVVVQKYAKGMNGLNFLIVLACCQFIFSLFLTLLFRGKLSAIPKNAWGWLIFGATLMGTVCLLFMVPIALKGKATSVNVLYSSRGIWSIALVWFIGHWFDNKEKHAGRNIMLQRLVGSILLLVAICLVVA